MRILPPLTSELQALILPDRVPESAPKPVRSILVQGADHSGDEAYYLYFVFPDHASDDNLSWKLLKPLIQWGRETIWKASGEQYPVYVHIRRESDSSLPAHAIAE